MHLRNSDDNAMLLYDDGFWRFALRVNLNISAVNLHMRVKREEGNFIVRLGPYDSFTIQPELDNIDQLLEHLFSGAKEFLDQEFADSVAGKRSMLGFKTPFSTAADAP
jgi:hypothetical protein